MLPIIGCFANQTSLPETEEDLWCQSNDCSFLEGTYLPLYLPLTLGMILPLLVQARCGGIYKILPKEIFFFSLDLLEALLHICVLLELLLLFWCT